MNSETQPTKPLQGKVAVVAGATRGAGRGIAVMLGAAGATVYVTGRSVKGNPATAGRSETIEETAELVTAQGGIGIPMRVDHTVEADI
jgi:NAD(P)-dependent dehydrogenase (short-subunit alcohol dehydrogenase family)